MEKKFRIVKAKMMREDGSLSCRWLVTEDAVPLYSVNEWVDIKSMRKISTGKEYASKLVVYLNYLDMIGKTFEAADYNDVASFVLYIIYGDRDDLTIRSLDAQIAHSTLSKYITVITEFYKWLDKTTGSNMSFQTKRNYRRAKKSYLYGQIYRYEYKYIIDRHLLRLNASREYIKWYSAEEIEALCKGFIKQRDRAIFLITLQGFRIDEVLSMQLDDYDFVSGRISPMRSKGKPDASGGTFKHRSVVLPPATLQALDSYIATERADAETDSGYISQYIFINLKRGVGQGQPLKYRTYWEILKKCARRAGLDCEKVRTHSGRSTNVMAFLEHQALHPEDGITDAIILEHFGWRGSDSIESYKNHNNQIIAKAAFDKLHKDKGENK